MAIEYSLISALGMGTSASVTIASPCVLTAVNMVVGFAFRFVDNAGDTLPTGISKDTSYYVTAVLTPTTYTFSDSLGGADISTSGSQSGGHEISDNYYHTLSAADKARYDNGTRNFAGLIAFFNYYKNTAYNSDLTKDLVAEIYDKFNDSKYVAFPYHRGFKSITIHTKVKGVRTPAFHYGVKGSGYKMTSTYASDALFVVSNPNTTVDGLELILGASSTVAGFTGYTSQAAMAAGTRIVNNILTGFSVTQGTGVNNLGAGSLIYNNIITNWNTGFLETASTPNTLFAFNTVTQCGIGIGSVTTSITAFYQTTYYANNVYNNSTRDWPTIGDSRARSASQFFAAYNCSGSGSDLACTFETYSGNLGCRATGHGLSASVQTAVVFYGDAGAVAPTGIAFGVLYYVRLVLGDVFSIVTTPSGSVSVTYTDSGSGNMFIRRTFDSIGSAKLLTDNSFVDYAGGDFRPGSSAGDVHVPHAESTHVGIVDMTLVNDLPAFDIADAVRPNYVSATYPNNFATAGAFEFDHGEGLAPIFPEVTLTANVSLLGSEIRIYDLDGVPAGSLGTELAGTESNATSDYVINTLSSGNIIWIQIMLDGYREYGLQFTIPSSTSALPVILQVDQNK